MAMSSLLSPIKEQKSVLAFRNVFLRNFSINLIRLTYQKTNKHHVSEKLVFEQFYFIIEM